MDILKISIISVCFLELTLNSYPLEHSPPDTDLNIPLRQVPVVYSQSASKVTENAMF